MSGKTRVLGGITVIDTPLVPSPVFDMTIDLDGVPDGYAAMDERKALKVLVKL